MADAPEPFKPEGLKGGVLEWFSGHPLVGFISFVVGIVSFIATVYFGVATLTSRDLCLTVNPTKTTIVRAGQSSDLHVLYKGQSVSTDVTALQVEIWNAGKESIRPEHVLSPVVLQTAPKVPILEVRLRHVSRPVCNIALDESQLADGKVSMTWKILEQNDGVVLQLIVAGPSNVTVVGQGAMEGDSSIRQAAVTDSGSLVWALEKSFSLFLLSGWIGATGGMILNWRSRRYKQRLVLEGRRLDAQFRALEKDLHESPEWPVAQVAHAAFLKNSAETERQIDSTRVVSVVWLVMTIIVIVVAVWKLGFSSTIPFPFN